VVEDVYSFGFSPSLHLDYYTISLVDKLVISSLANCYIEVKLFALVSLTAQSHHLRSLVDSGRPKLRQYLAYVESQIVPHTLPPELIHEVSFFYLFSIFILRSMDRSLILAELATRQLFSLIL
jgi:methyltransferase-like protein